MKLSNAVVQFAGENTDFYIGFSEYFNKNEKSADDTKAVNEGFFAEVERVSGVAREGLRPEAWATNPQVQWGFMSVVDATINTILPQIITPAFGMFMDMRFLDVGDTMKFEIKPNQFYTVSLGN